MHTYEYMYLLDNEAEEVDFQMQKEEYDDNVKNTHRPFLEDVERTDCARQMVGDISKKIYIFRHIINSPDFRLNQLRRINKNSLYMGENWEKTAKHL